MIKSRINQILGLLGYRIIKTSGLPHSPLDGFFATLSGLGAQPSFLLDIGANHGRWTRKAREYFPNAEIWMIEPQERLRRFSEHMLQHPGVRWKTAGIADKIGDLMLSLPPRDDSASFCISEERAISSGFERIRVPVTTIDALVAEARKIPDIIKIDAEGFDLKALKGAASVLGKTETILIECAISPHQMENTLEAVLPLMWANGYRVMDISDLNHSPTHGVLWLAEFVFVHHSSPMWSRIQQY